MAGFTAHPSIDQLDPWIQGIGRMILIGFLKIDLHIIHADGMGHADFSGMVPRNITNLRIGSDRENTIVTAQALPGVVIDHILQFIVQRRGVGPLTGQSMGIHLETEQIPEMAEGTDTSVSLPSVPGYSFYRLPVRMRER